MPQTQRLREQSRRDDKPVEKVIPGKLQVLEEDSARLKSTVIFIRFAILVIYTE